MSNPSFNTIDIAGITNDSIVDGPGIRLAIFAQGCKHNCKGCHNPVTHEFLPDDMVIKPSFTQPGPGGDRYSIEAIFNEVLKASPLTQGVTFTGGDPLYQWSSFMQLAGSIKGLDLDIWCYTGFVWESIKQNPLMKYIDVLVDGPYIESLRTLELPYRGSSNQRLIDVQKSLAIGSMVPYNMPE